MERDGDSSSSFCSAEGSHPNGERDHVSSGKFFLDGVGEVLLDHHPDKLSWKLIEAPESEGSACLGIKLGPKVAVEIKFSDAYAVELSDYLMHRSELCNSKNCFLKDGLGNLEMYRFTLHGFEKSRTDPCIWNLATYTFGHKDLQTCHLWVNQINDSINTTSKRPKNLLVFVHPRSGKAKGCRTWETVAPIFSSAKVKTKVIVTQRAGHAFDVMASISNKELSSYDGVIAVGGDGFFNEVFNGFLLSRLKAPLPPMPSQSTNFVQSIENSSVSSVSESEVVPVMGQNEDFPLLQDSVQNGAEVPDTRTGNGSCEAAENIAEDQDLDFLFDNERFRFGLIPAGSTDAIVICTTGARDPITSALHIVLGRKVCIDAVQMVRWKLSSTSKVEPYIRYAASFAGYGFYGDVISESEKYRWMGPKRYDYVGTKVFMKHRSYEAEVIYQEIEPADAKNGRPRNKLWPLRATQRSERVVCRANCGVCSDKLNNTSTRSAIRTTPYSCPKETRWARSKGRFLSIGAAVMSNRNEKAPDGLVADAHLSDGFLHLILIKDCSRPMYLWHLTELAKKGGNPLDFEFVEYHKTPAFTFTSFGNEGVWNLDGEIFQAHQLSAQVFHGLISLFASGPEV